MKFSHLLLPLFLLFSFQIQSLYAQNSIIGTWTNPSTSISESDYCCVPNSLTIENSGLDRYTATYKYYGLLDTDHIYNKKCFNLFLGTNSGQLRVFKKSDLDGYYSETTIFGSKVFNFEVINETNLKINIATSDNDDACDFSMNTKESSALYSGGHIVFYASLLIIIIAAFASFKSYQKKQQDLLNKQNLNEPQSPNKFVISNQQFGQSYYQPQAEVGYTAPGLFPSSTNSSVVSVDINGVN